MTTVVRASAFAFAFSVAAAFMFAVPASLAASPGKARSLVAPPDAVDAPPPSAMIPPGGIAELDDAVIAEIMAHFVVTFYLSGKSMSPAEIEQLYAPRVRYFDGTELTRKAVIRDKLDYFKRWPDRTFSLVPDTMEVFRDESDLVDVTFQYEFVVRSPKRTSRGRGHAKLTLDFTDPAGRIVREEGDVISRY